MKFVFLLSSLFLISVKASAGWTEYGTIRAVMPYDDGTIHVWANMPRHDPASCGNDRYIMATDKSNKKETLSIALAALAAKLNVRLLIDNSCTSNNPTLRAIELRP